MDSRKRDRVIHFVQTIEENEPGNSPPMDWWILVFTLRRVLDATNITMKLFQGEQISLDQQIELLEDLRQ